MKKKIFFILLIGAITVTELILHLFYSERFEVAYRPVVYRRLPVVNYGYVPDTTFTLFGKTHYINKQGFLGKDFSEKSQDTFRIAIVGSSSVAGSINLKAYYSFCPILEQKFAARHAKVQVLNCGIDGNERDTELFNSIRYQVMGFHPDMIFLEFDLPFYSSNAVRENYKGYVITYPAPDKEGKEFCQGMVDNLVTYKKGVDLLYHSYIVQSVARWYCRKYQTKLTWYINLYQSKFFIYGDFIPFEFSMDASVKMVQALKTELDEAGIKFFLFQPSMSSPIIYTAKTNHLPLLSLGVSFEENDHFPGDTHWNENGCEKVANRFYELILKYKLIPEAYSNPIRPYLQPDPFCYDESLNDRPMEL